MRKSFYKKEEQKAKTVTHELHFFSFFLSLLFILFYFMEKGLFVFILIKFQEEFRRQLREWEKEVVGPFTWQEAINKDSGGTSNSSKSKDVRKDKSISNIKRKGETI